MKQIECIHLFPQLTEELLKLLRSLNHKEWLKPSPIKNRTVKDLVSHLIDGSLRKLSIQRDGFEDKSISPNINSYDDLVQHIQILNSDWMNILRRLSPEILIDLLEYSETQFNEFIKTLNPRDKALYGVAWAGEMESENWFDIAREYTEKWHHQMQIRLALNKPVLMDVKFTEPLFDTFMQGLPHLYKNFTNYETGDRIKFSITGTLNKSWVIEQQDERWVFVDDNSNNIKSSIEIADEIAWQLFTNTIRDKQKYKSIIKCIGNKKVADTLIEYVTVMS